MTFPAWLQDLDEAWFLAINVELRDALGDSLTAMLRAANEYGNGWTLLPLFAVVALLPAASPRVTLRRLFELGLALLVTLLLVTLLKELVGRPRPLAVVGGAIADFDGPLYTRSFPSGHTAQAFTTSLILIAWARALTPTWRRWLAIAVLFLAAALVGIARVYGGAHFPLDVIAGALLGAIAAWTARATVALTLKRRTTNATPTPEADPQPTADPND